MDLADHFGNLRSPSKASVEDLETLPDIGPVTLSIVEFFQEEPVLEALTHLFEAGWKSMPAVSLDSGFANDSDDPAGENTGIQTFLAGKKRTGTIEGWNRRDLENSLRQAGARPKGRFLQD